MIECVCEDDIYFAMPTSRSIWSTHFLANSASVKRWADLRARSLIGTLSGIDKTRL